MKTAEQQVDSFNRRFRIGYDVDVLWNQETGRTIRTFTQGPAFVWQSGEAVVETTIGTVLCEAVHMPPGVGG